MPNGQASMKPNEDYGKNANNGNHDSHTSHASAACRPPAAVVASRDAGQIVPLLDPEQLNLEHQDRVGRNLGRCSTPRNPLSRSRTAVALVAITDCIVSLPSAFSTAIEGVIAIRPATIGCVREVSSLSSIFKLRGAQSRARSCSSGCSISN